MDVLEIESPWTNEAATVDGREAAIPLLRESSHELESPFRGGVSFTERPETEGLEPELEFTGTARFQELQSPFASRIVTTAEVDERAEAFRDLLGELRDEAFEEAVARLANEAAALHLASQASWSSAEAAPSLAVSELEAWIEPLAAEADRLLEDMAARLANEEIETLRESELDTLLESFQTDAGSLPESFEQFLGGLLKKAKKVVKGAWRLAKKGVQAAGRVLPLGILLKKLSGLVRPLLRRVLQRAIGRLPAGVRPLAQRLAARFAGELEAEVDGASMENDGLGREFDVHVASLALAADEPELNGLLSEVETEAGQESGDRLAELDDARARLAEQLVELPAGESPVPALEQFIPAVMAALPAIRLGISAVGRDRVVRFLADRIGSLIGSMVGPESARVLARPIVDVGLRMLSLESPPASETTLGGEALASTAEETVRQVLALPAHAFEDGLRMEAEAQQAFAEAAARNVPNEFLRPDLPERETAGEGGVWVLMPRVARPHYRYKKYSRVFLVPVSRQTARSIPVTDGGTLEATLLDRGVTSWPAQAEVHLYEAVPGTALGHVARFEMEGDVPLGEALEEFQPLTPESASLLLREPALGRPAAVPDGRSAGGLRPGQRFYRLKLREARRGSARPRRRLRVVLDLLQSEPQIRVQVALSEREGQVLAERLDKRHLPWAVAWLKQRYERTAPALLAARLLAVGTRLPGITLTQARARDLGAQMTEAMTAALTAFLRQRHQELTAAVREPQQGLTITFAFAARDRSALLGTPVVAPSVTVRAGWPRG